MSLPIPTSREALTPQWFSEVLSSTDSPVVVDTVAVDPIGEGSGMMSELSRVTLTYASGDGPNSVVVKAATPIEQNRAVAVAFDNYRREVDFYRRAAHATPMRTAKVFTADYDAPDRFILVLEDLSGWDQGDQIAGCALDRAEAVMDSLADLHAHFWGKVDGGDMDWLPDSHPSIMSEGLSNGTEAAWDDFAQFFADILSPELIGAKTRYLAGLPAVLSWLNDAPRSVIHGDFRMDNLFFRKPTDGQGLEVACCDWQAPTRGKSIQDVAYFLSGSVDVSMRRQHEHTLVTRWADGLAARGVEGYGADQAFEDYRKAILMLWTYVVVIGGGLAAANERGSSWVSAMVERSAVAMMDHGCLELL